MPEKKIRDIASETWEYSPPEVKQNSFTYIPHNISIPS